jgi:lysozyme
MAASPIEVLPQAIELVKHYEGFRARRYVDAAGIPTIGYGDTELAKTRETITREEAERELIAKLERLQARISTLDEELSPYDLGAAVSFAYNCGFSALVRSSWYSALRKRRRREATRLLLLWHRVNTKPLRGLLRRRVAEGLIIAHKDWRIADQIVQISSAGLEQLTGTDKAKYLDDLNEMIWASERRLHA